MRKPLLVLLFIILSCIYGAGTILKAQGVAPGVSPRVGGFWGVPFGSDKEQVRAMMAQRGLKIEEETADRMMYEGSKGTQFAGYGVALASLRFFEGKFFGADIVLQPTDNSEILSNYHSLKAMLAEKYGTPKAYEFFTEPRSEGEINPASAIKKGRCTYSAHWNIADPDGAKRIILQVTKLLALELSYEHKAMAQAYKERERLRLLSDL